MNQSRRNFLQMATIFAYLNSLPIASADAAPVDLNALRSLLLQIADQAIKDGASPGIQIEVWRQQHSIASVARGFSNIETSALVTANTVFRAGSLTKQFTAALIAKLQEQGRLSVNDRLNKHLDFFIDKQAPTLLELIHHTAGIHDEHESTVDTARTSQMDLAKRIANQTKLYDFSPGTAWLYSNANYVLLGAVIESVTKLPLAQAAEQIIFKPLGLHRTRFDNSAAVVKNRASGYSTPETSETSFVNAEFIPIEHTGGAGAIRSNASDLCQWHQSLFANKFLSAKSLESVVAPARLRDGRLATKERFDPNDNNMGDTSYGYGLLLDRATKDGSLIAMHNGFVNGFSAYLATHVPSMLTIACMCNADPGPKLPFRQLRRTFFSEFL